MKEMRALIAKPFPFFPPANPAGYDLSEQHPQLDSEAQQESSFIMDAPRPRIRRHGGVTRGFYGNTHLAVGT
jgi:hypothetical protein